MNVVLLMILGFAIMLLLNLFRHRKYNISVPKSIIITFLVGMMGLIGTQILYFIENGSFNGRSFFGAVLFFPPLLLPIALIFKIHLLDLLDYACPPGMAMLTLFKINCHIVGCCGGSVMYYTESGSPVFFPIQIFESLLAFIIMAILLYFEYRNLMRRNIYPVCLILYGVERFVLNWFRWQKTEFVFGLPAGNFWSIIAVLIGVIWLTIFHYKKKSNRAPSEQSSE